MSILEQVISVIAPHICLGCGAEGAVLCANCSASSLLHLPPRCVFCHKFSPECKTCNNCRRKAKLRSVWVCAEYSPLAKGVIAAYKFENKRAAASDIARVMFESLPVGTSDWVIVPVPTISRHVRGRGFDHTKLIARELSRISGLEMLDILRRTDQRVQVGSKRAERLSGLEGSLRVVGPRLIEGTNVLLVDDVVTTGATISAAAQALKSAGVKSVDALVFAQSA